MLGRFRFVLIGFVVLVGRSVARVDHRVNPCHNCILRFGDRTTCCTNSCFFPRMSLVFNGTAVAASLILLVYPERQGDAFVWCSRERQWLFLRQSQPSPPPPPLLPPCLAHAQSASVTLSSQCCPPLGPAFSTKTIDNRHKLVSTS